MSSRRTGTIHRSGCGSPWLGQRRTGGGQAARRLGALGTSSLGLFSHLQRQVGADTLKHLSWAGLQVSNAGGLGGHRLERGNLTPPSASFLQASPTPRLVSEVKCLGAAATRAVTGTPAPRVRAARVSPQRAMLVFSFPQTPLY